MTKTKLEVLKEHFDRLTPVSDPVHREALRLEAIVEDVERMVSDHLATFASPGGASFDSFLNDLRAKYAFKDQDVKEETAAAKEAWHELEEEWMSKSLRRTGSRAPLPLFGNPFSGCTWCKIAVSGTLIALGGALGLVAAYSAGTAAPAYFVAAAAALGISVTSLYTILGMVVAGTIGVSSIPKQICKAKHKC